MHILDAAAVVSYGAYYVSYRVAKIVPGPQPGLWGPQAIGLGGDIAINCIKSKIGYPQQCNDHGGTAPILPDFAQNKLWWDKGLEVSIPGWHHDDRSKIDFAW